MNTTIQLLKKVTLSLRAGSKPGTYNLTGSPVSLKFVYGVASDGVCQFEAALDGKQTGHKLTLSIKNANAHEFFGHIFHDLCQTLGLQIMPKEICLGIEVTAVTNATDREVVQAVANASSHGGCGGSCGCGC